ncbi:MAG: L-threonylcarbamoyladenylate synthase [Desulfobulbaceae bacterium]|jgi:L-threonylcarbamoyladenylate synthase|nr:L-threonylcarbamoyladenylate synthase [Desulfobulbaceae bacterium]MDH3541505.1 L-threonylcarbamoyladenylate synthase [Desulfobulbaceae bacterium]MDH3776577.1 L-threonylcarbamoyladenylate synthase [Desulfobulbaceae bacterium]MDH3782632.1 L-threonylcarbamoyladenylate synthase [Desulfobulbaceae bacterium]MDH3867464.1 L-threonylcarbamoyladenylate synthase [Desulfobulbaceae bacterium]
MKYNENGRHTVAYQPCSMADLNRAVAVLNGGGVVAFPTETYYGLAVDPLNPLALNHLFSLKQRDISKPILTLVDDRASLSFLAQDIPIIYEPLMKEFWPGPLTLIFQARLNLPTLLTAGTSTIGVRHSSHPFARQLLRAFGRPLTATSANISGYAAAVDAYEVKTQFGSKIDVVFDGGRTPGTVGSTIIGLEGDRLKLIREGVIPYRDILRVFQKLESS